jgi:hypothetical protein
MPNQDGGHLGFYLNHRTPSYFFLSLHISEVQFFYNARLRELIRTGPSGFTWSAFRTLPDW